LKICLIGCGEHAQGSHGPAQARYAAAHPGTELVGCCDLDGERAESHRRKFGFARAYTDIGAMIDKERPDVAIVAVPVERTPDVAAPLLDRGLPLLIEKPPGRTVEEVDRLARAADIGGRGRPVPHQVAFNRRFAPVVSEARRRLAALAPAEIQHVHYEMTRVDRRDPDFSTTAIHGLDCVRFLAGSDYAEARLRYHDLPALGPTVANIFVDAVMASGATAHLAFCPAAGAVVERATVHARDETLFVRIPMWGPIDAPGRLHHARRGETVADLAGDALGGSDEACVLGGFYGEYEAFLGDLAAGRTPSPSLRESRQSVAIAESVRRREKEFHA
jgi:myo-inositol 2-dehydrogenase / D-chiro-inositol 1-dehydrogenase